MMSIKYNTEEMQKKLRDCLTEERYLHSLGTMETAIKLAQDFGCDEEKAKIAGLLHDCAKCLSKKESENYFYALEDFEKIAPKTWHAPIGAVIAREKYGTEDEEILSAIRWHTVGKPDMSVLEKIIFLADKIEPRTRVPEISENPKRILEETQSLDAAILECFSQTIKSLVDRELPISYQTVEVYNDLINKQIKQGK